MDTIGDLVEHLRCSLCKRYLSCAPIQILSDGSSVCSCCAPTTGAVQTYRQLTLEAELSKTIFPCLYRKFGCKERLLFGYTSDHESKCEYRTVTCPFKLLGTSLWKGSARQVHKHFKKTHPQNIIASAEFKLEINKDSDDFLIVTVDEVHFVLRYLYCAASGNLDYDVRYLTCNLFQEAVYKVRLINGVDPEYYSAIKGGTCAPYNDDAPHAGQLILPDFLPALNRPHCIRIILDVAVCKSPQQISNTENRSVNYSLLEVARCKQCGGYLVPPIFTCKKGTVCSKCHVEFGSSQPSTNEKLKALLAKTNFPCRWRGCDFIATSDDFHQHEDACQFRTHACPREFCKDTFKRDEAEAHLEEHGYKFFSDVFVYKIVMNQKATRQEIATFKNNQLLSFSYQTYENDGYVHEIYALNEHRESVPKNVCLKVDFSHQHCKLKSKKFDLLVKNSVHSWGFVVRKFPGCFKEDEELTVTLRM